MCETTRPPIVCVSSKPFDSACGLSPVRVAAIGSMTFFSFRTRLRFQLNAIRRMNATNAMGSATRRTRIVRCIQLEPNVALRRLFRGTCVDDGHPPADIAPAIRLDLHEEIDC